MDPFAEIVTVTQQVAFWVVTLIGSLFGTIFIVKGLIDLVRYLSAGEADKKSKIIKVMLWDAGAVIIGVLVIIIGVAVIPAIFNIGIDRLAQG